MIGTNSETALNKLTQPELIQFLMKTKATQDPRIADLSKEVKVTLIHLKKFQADTPVFRIVNNRLLERLVKTEKQSSFEKKEMIKFFLRERLSPNA